MLNEILSIFILLAVLVGIIAHLLDFYPLTRVRNWRDGKATDETAEWQAFKSGFEVKK